MSAKTKNILILISIVIIVAFVIKFIVIGYYQYAIIAATLELVNIAFCIRHFQYLHNPHKMFEKEVYKILKTYDSLLASSKELPNLNSRDIIIVDDMEDLINIQLELRKPIFYIKATTTCTFILIYENEAYIFISKENKDELTKLELEVKKIKNIQSNNVIDMSIFNKIDKKTIIKLPNSKSYEIFPVLENNENKATENNISNDKNEDLI